MTQTTTHSAGPAQGRPADDLEVLTFRMGGETFAIEATLVREILDLMPETPVPGADPMVSHVINFRGRVIPLANLRHAFRMDSEEATKDSRIVVIELPIGDEPHLIGLRADRVDEVTILPAACREEAPAIGLRWPRENVRGLFRRETDVIVLPDLAAIFRALADAVGGATIH